jgi:hypothetical protein
MTEGKTRTIPRKHGVEKLEVVQCKCCEEWPEIRNAYGFALSKGTKSFDTFDPDTDGWLCEQCLSDMPIDHPSSTETTTNRIGMDEIEILLIAVLLVFCLYIVLTAIFMQF